MPYKDKEKAKEYCRNYRLTHKAKKKQYQEEYYKKNKETSLNRSKEYYKFNKSRIIERVSVWKANNRQKVKSSAHNRNRKLKAKYSQMLYRARRKGIPVNICYDEYLCLVKDSVCNYCGGLLPETGVALDRIDSTLGYTVENVAPCCTRCNSIFMMYNKDETYSHIEKMMIYKNSFLDFKQCAKLK